MIEKIDFSRLKRNYKEDPLRKGEIAFKEDLLYLYIELNLRQSFLMNFFQCSEQKLSKMLKFFKIKKSKELKQILIQETTFNHYGVSTCMKSIDFQQKINQTKRKRYGQRLEKITRKMKQTCLNKYGVESANSLQWKIKKAQETNLKRYGNINPLNSLEIKERRKRILLEKYGVDNIFKLPDFFSRYSFKRHPSKPEKRCLDLLLEKFPDTIHQYKDSRYPFHCDFYIPSLDLFIECQFGPHHQYKPFNENDINCINQARELLKNKSGRVRSWFYYWTEIDPLKRKVAKENNLNYLEFFTEKDFLDWFCKK